MEKIVKRILALILLTGIGSYFLIGHDSNSDVIDNITEKPISVEGIRIIAFGDSLTAGYGLPINESYPAQLEVALKAAGQNVSVINSGVSGETTRGNLERANFIRSQNPDIVLLGIGGNDALRALPIEDTIKNITDTVQILKGGDNPPVVILLQMQSPLNAGLNYKRTFDALYREIATEQDILLVPFVTTEIFLNPENKIADGIHLNKVGYGKVVEEYLLDSVSQVVTNLGG